MTDAQPKTIYLTDYQVPDFLIDQTDLTFALAAQATQVSSVLSVSRNPESSDQQAALVLHGQELKLLSVTIDNQLLNSDQYQVDAEQLIVANVPDQFQLKIEVLINPQDNTSLEGLYKSRTMYCTQCEAEGFRKITYYLDRPDVLSEFTTTVIADKTEFPVLLSNGNSIKQGDMADGKHFATWHDPFRKPAYLFALVAGDLDVISDTFTTCSQRNIELKIFVEAKDIDKCQHAMDSLKKSMRWDEQVFGREYDLDIFMIVAVDDFNMGAMENKGLNIFNTSCVLAKPETTTDATYQRVEAIVAHEYFHNWSGNRVTCRDWFQLSLKEGFTVFRDSEFSADMNSRTVSRVENVSLLRTMQFAEDGGPMAHPVQPPSFMEISNFYTLTIYEKGAEVVGMIRTLLGSELFRNGSDLYFDRHDGQAVTIQDFVAAMESASGRDLTQFKRWYSQAGTPVLQVSSEYSADQQQYQLTFKQSCPSTPEANSDEKQPFHIPVAIGLLGEAGNLPVTLEGEQLDADTGDNTHRVLELTQAHQTFVFNNVKEQPIPALLRGFSAPVKLHYDYSRDELMRLMSAEDDGFCRWDACQQLAIRVISDAIKACQSQQPYQVDERLIEAYRQILTDESLDKAMVALMLQLPSQAYLSELADEIDVAAIHSARESVRQQIAVALESLLQSTYTANKSSEVYAPTAEQIAQRSLKNICLSYLSLLEANQYLSLAQTQLQQATNMTDSMSALVSIVNRDYPDAESARIKALADFYQQWQHETLVINQWLSVQATSILPGGLDRVKALLEHDAFDVKNPNKVRSVIGAFCNSNAINFHVENGAGYQFLADQIVALDKMNPQIASRLLTPLTRWRKYSSTRQASMKSALERILATADLSKDVFEVVSKSL